MKLSDYRLATSPPLRTTIATVRLLLQNHPDRLGQAVLFQPPRIFAPLWAAAASVLPADTLAKVRELRRRPRRRTPSLFFILYSFWVCFVVVVLHALHAPAQLRCTAEQRASPTSL